MLVDLPLFGPALMVKLTETLGSGVPDASSSVAVTVACDPVLTVCVAGLRVSVADEAVMSLVPIGRHWSDSLELLQFARSKPPVSRMWPLSTKTAFEPSLSVTVRVGGLVVGPAGLPHDAPGSVL
jgi:hypothetical protein